MLWKLRKIFTEKCKIGLLSDPILKGHFTSRSVEDVNGTLSWWCITKLLSFYEIKAQGGGWQREMMAASDVGLF